ncbi:MAG: hypothetical protein FWD52_04655 [Candidatus Bathyarchaeota archaeon]|nr:hypothetical protein [Candidatus Termiticorpusculum sp.]
MVARSYVVTGKNYSSRRSQGLSLYCHRCERAIKVGDAVTFLHRNQSTGESLKKIYHTKCWEAMFV